MDNASFNYEIKRFSNKSSDVSNPQLRSLSILVAFNARFQATDYHYTKENRISNSKSFHKAVRMYLGFKKISLKNVVTFPLYVDENGNLTAKHKVVKADVAGFAFFLKDDLREKYNIVKITRNVKKKVFEDLVVEIEDYNSFLQDDVWLVVVGKPHGKNFVVYGRRKINAKLRQIEEMLSPET